MASSWTIERSYYSVRQPFLLLFLLPSPRLIVTRKSSYNEAISLTKAWQDQVWQASALEGLVIALVVQATLPKPHLDGVSFRSLPDESREELNSNFAARFVSDTSRSFQRVLILLHRARSATLQLSSLQYQIDFRKPFHFTKRCSLL